VAYSLRNTTATAVEARSTPAGNVNVYTAGTASTGGLFNDFATWTCDPRYWYNGASTIRAGEVDSVAGVFFGYTGGSQTYTVPATGVTQLMIEARGGQGGGQAGSGRGAVVSCVVNVTGGETLTLIVGGQGLGSHRRIPERRHRWHRFAAQQSELRRLRRRRFHRCSAGWHGASQPGDCRRRRWWPGRVQLNERPRLRRWHRWLVGYTG
jgi:hypothetical protein